jgi:hypothetical protein
MRRLSLAHGLVVSIICTLPGVCLVGAKPAPQAENVLVPAGAEVIILTKTAISSNIVFTGDRLTFEVAQDVIVNGRVVIAKGALAEAVVTLAARPRGFGRSGKLSIRVETLTAVDGQKIKLRAALNERGDGQTGKAAILTILGGGLAGAMLGKELKGSNARIKAGTEIKVATAEEKAVSVVPIPSPAQDQGKNPKDPLLR